MKIILDTNIIISFLLNNDFAIKIIEYVNSAGIELFADSRLIHEYKTIAQRKKFGFSAEQIDFINNWIENNVNQISLADYNIKFNHDRQDSKLIEIANQINCDYIISSDKIFTNKAQYLTKTRLISPEIFCSKFINN